MKSIHAKTTFWGKFATWTNTHKKISIGLTVGMVAMAAGLVAAAFLWPSSTPVIGLTLPAKKDIQPIVFPTKFFSPLTGIELPDEPATKRQVTAIMIENSPDARPQSGLKDAGVVFEAIAEGGITRFLTIHQEDRPQLIGPVRSLRPYYVDWLAPFDAAVAHVGGSANALAEIRNGTYKDIDQFFNSKAYWRASDRYAPHNVYTSFDKLDELNKSKNFTSSSFTGWPRKLDSTPGNTATSIDIDISSPLYDVHYDFDPGGNKYFRSHGSGGRHKDREAGEVAPKVVIVIKVPVTRGFEDGWREQMTTIGHNTAYIFQDGTVREAIWRKAGRKEQIQFYEKSGRPIPLNRGQTWITAIAPEKQVTWR